MSNGDKEREPLNEEPGKDARNSFPKGDKIDFRRAGRAGVRVLVERALRTHHGFDEPLWEELGISKRQIAKNGELIVEALRRIVADPERGRYTDRTISSDQDPTALCRCLLMAEHYLKLTRTQTIMQGAAFCNFRYEMQDDANGG